MKIHLINSLFALSLAGAFCEEAPSLTAPQRASVTWTNYSESGRDSDKVVYFFNRQAVGIGDAGLRKLLAHLQKLKAGTIVEVYPKGGVNFDEAPSMGISDFLFYPFHGHFREFFNVSKQAGLDVRFVDPPRSEQKQNGSK